MPAHSWEQKEKEKVEKFLKIVTENLFQFSAEKLFYLVIFRSSNCRRKSMPRHNKNTEKEI